MKRALPLISGLLAFVALSAQGGDSRRGPQLTEAQAAPGAGQVSFRRDIAPVLVTSCSTRSCHGGGSRPPVLDPHADAASLRAALVGVASEQRPERDYVRPGDPQASYVVQKLEGCLVDEECADADCGEPMPLKNPPLSAELRATIRAWIAQGASDN